MSNVRAWDIGPLAHHVFNSLSELRTTLAAEVVECCTTHMDTQSSPAPFPGSRRVMSPAQKAALQKQVERLEQRSDATVRALTDFLATGGFTPAERRAVEFCRKVLRVATSLRAEIAQPVMQNNPGNLDMPKRKRRHADAARALMAARDVVDQAEAALQTGMDELPTRDTPPRSRTRAERAARRAQQEEEEASDG